MAVPVSSELGSVRRPEACQPSSRRAGELEAINLDVAFQPIVDLHTGQVFAAEALVRCQWPEFQSPVTLFECAQAEAVCGSLGRKIRSVAFERCPAMPLFVNLHPHELSEKWLVRPDDPLFFHDSEVFLEVTEAAAFTYFDLCLDVLKEVCSRAGAYLVIDDLGAGHSNLMRIVDLEPSVVKLDLALARGIHLRPRQQILVRQLVALCEEMGADVVVEGVECLEELQAVRDTGARYAQGYFLARPGYPLPEVYWPLSRSVSGRPPTHRRVSRSR